MLLKFHFETKEDEKRIQKKAPFQGLKVQLIWKIRPIRLGLASGTGSAA